jgi:serine/threonine protein kinase
MHLVSGRIVLRFGANLPMADPHEALKKAHDLTGTNIGRFTVGTRLGMGGMGQVYRAEDTTLKRVVAIKRLAPQFQFDSRDRERFLKEAQRASALNHPNVAAIYEVLQERGEILLVMEYVEGVTLRQRMRKPVSIEEFLEIAVQCVEGLVAAHEKRIVHGDIKPENIMLTASQRVKILDFGVAKRFTTTDSTDVTESLASMTASRPATINHDLRVLRRMMRLAERKQLIARNPFVQVEFLKQSAPRPPHIVTFEEEERILTVAAPYMRVLVVLILETGMRSHREALALRWDGTGM